MEGATQRKSLARRLCALSSSLSCWSRASSRVASHTKPPHLPLHSLQQRRCAPSPRRGTCGPNRPHCACLRPFARLPKRRGDALNPARTRDSGNAPVLKMPAARPRASFEPIPPDFDVRTFVETAENFQYVDRISYEMIASNGIEQFEKLVLLHVIIGGKPLVIDGFEEALDPWTFTPSWLRDNHGDKGTLCDTNIDLTTDSMQSKTRATSPRKKTFRLQ